MSTHSATASRPACSIQSRRRAWRTTATLDPEQPGFAVQSGSASADGRLANEGNRCCTGTSAANGEVAPATCVRNMSKAKEKANLCWSSEATGSQHGIMVAQGQPVATSTMYLARMRMGRGLAGLLHAREVRGDSLGAWSGLRMRFTYFRVRNVSRTVVTIAPRVCAALICCRRLLFGALGCLYFLTVATANGVQHDASREIDLVKFFRTAITSPPDIDYFVASQRMLRERKLPPEIQQRVQLSANQPPVFFEGARSGSNYFLRSTGSANPLDGDVGTTMVVGRAGSETYHINPNTVTYTFDNADASTPHHTLLSLGATYHSLVRQFLHMGLSNVRAETVEWNIDEFTALRDDGSRVYGYLELSDGLPHRLSVATHKGERPYRSYTYEYPLPATALAGFPSRITSATTIQDGMHPTVEYGIWTVRLSKHIPAEDTFSKSRFLGPHIQNTNVFEGGTLFNRLHGELIKDLQQPVVEGHGTSRRYGRLAIFCVIALVLLPGGILLLSSVKRTRTTITDQVI
jgi:hypothetical protein